MIPARGISNTGRRTKIPRVIAGLVPPMTQREQAATPVGMTLYRDVASSPRRRRVATTFTACVFVAGWLWTAPVHATPPPSLASPAADAGGEPGLLCRRAMRQAEAGSLLPQYLLEAIARVESGRPDPVTGRIHPWPWTINAEGQGSFFPTKAEAIAFTRQLQARGVRSIDVGCMQVNLMHHPDAFGSLDEAFDPDANARYAVRFLTQLRNTTGGWDAAAAWYHSASPELGIPYRAKVVAAMQDEAKGPAYGGSPESQRADWPVVAAALPAILAGHARIIMLPHASSGITPERASAMVVNAMTARTTLAATNLPGMGLGGIAGGAAISMPKPAASIGVGRGIAAYRMQPVAVARPTLIAAR
jgi:hypothetical protein